VIIIIMFAKNGFGLRNLCFLSVYPSENGCEEHNTEDATLMEAKRTWDMHSRARETLKEL
jgi:hypothetical protein